LPNFPLKQNVLKQHVMKMKTWMMVPAAVMAAVSGCLDPVSGPYRPAADDFTVSLVVGGRGPEVAGPSIPNAQDRAVAGPDVEGIQYGSIRNTIQVIVVKADTGKVTNFQQILRTSDAQSGEAAGGPGDTGGERRDHQYNDEAPGGGHRF
jgi:hypothetical protein